MQVLPEAAETFRAMKALTQFYDFYRAGRYNEALRVCDPFFLLLANRAVGLILFPPPPLLIL